MRHRHAFRLGGSARRLRLLVLANAVSLSGNVITTVAIPWLVLTTTGSAALAGIAVFAGVGGAAVGGLAAGRIVDAIGPVRTSAAADLLSGLAVAPLPILLALDALEIWHVVVLAVVGTLADSAGSTARQSLVPAAADAGGHPRERANALFTSAEHVGYLLGAPIAGLLIAAFGVGGALWVTVAAFAFRRARRRGFVRMPRPAPPPQRARAPALREAIAFIWADPALRALVVFPTAAVLLVGPLVPIVLPVLAREAFGDPVVLGLMVASYGAGGLLGAAALRGVRFARPPSAAVRRRLRRRGRHLRGDRAGPVPAGHPRHAADPGCGRRLARAAAGHHPSGALARAPAAPRRRAEHREHPGRRADRRPRRRLPHRRARPASDAAAADRRRRAHRRDRRDEQDDPPSSWRPLRRGSGQRRAADRPCRTARRPHGVVGARRLRHPRRGRDALGLGDRPLPRRALPQHRGASRDEVSTASSRSPASAQAGAAGTASITLQNVQLSSWPSVGRRPVHDRTSALHVRRGADHRPVHPLQQVQRDRRPAGQRERPMQQPHGLGPVALRQAHLSKPLQASAPPPPWSRCRGAARPPR